MRSPTSERRILSTLALFVVGRTWRKLRRRAAAFEALRSCLRCHKGENRTKCLIAFGLIEELVQFGTILRFEGDILMAGVGSTDHSAACLTAMALISELYAADVISMPVAMALREGIFVPEGTQKHDAGTAFQPEPRR